MQPNWPTASAATGPFTWHSDPSTSALPAPWTDCLLQFSKPSLNPQETSCTQTQPHTVGVKVSHLPQTVNSLQLEAVTGLLRPKAWISQTSLIPNKLAC